MLFTESTSPTLVLIGLSEEVLNGSIGQVGAISIPPFIPHVVAPKNMLEVAHRDVSPIRPVFEYGPVMALVRNGILSPFDQPLPPNG